MRTIALLLLLALPAVSQDQPKDCVLTALYASSVVAHGAASAYDGWTSAHFGPGVVETNPLARNSAGGFDVKRGSAVKAGVFGATTIAGIALMHWTRRDRVERRWVKIGFTALNFTGAGVYYQAGRHNAGLK